ncbi:hypothetical protein PCAR4_40125 [Paraburkholderia caribensis]|nr:hypothetical protein PCAR4_40125 [Paraburkholderia caribensis]
MWRRTIADAPHIERDAGLEGLEARRDGDASGLRPEARVSHFGQIDADVRLADDAPAFGAFFRGRIFPDADRLRNIDAVTFRVCEPRVGRVRFGDLALSKPIFSHIVGPRPEIAGGAPVSACWSGHTELIARRDDLPCIARGVPRAVNPMTCNNS